MFYAIYMATRPRARAYILGLIQALRNNYYHKRTCLLHRDTQGMLVYSLKQSVSGPSSIISQRSADMSRAGTPPAGFVSGSLKQKIFKLLEEKSNGVYVKRLPKLFEIEYESEAPMNLAEIIKSLDFVNYEE